MIKNIMVMCEQHEGKITQSSMEMIWCAEKIMNGGASKITAVIPGNMAGTEGIPGADILHVSSPELEIYSAEGWERAGLAAAAATRPDIILIPHTSAAYDYGPRLAAGLEAPCITAVTGIELKEGFMELRRSGFHGKLDIILKVSGFPAVITVMAGIYSSGKGEVKPGRTEKIDLHEKLSLTSRISLEASPVRNPELENARVIISGGRGVGKKENFDILRSMAALFDRSAIAGSRVACDNGWINHSSQVGMTGKTVSPLLYIACGISGSPQHISGMKDSKTIVSINRDPEAAICRYSDICVTGDYEEFIRAFIDEAEKQRSQK